MRRRFKSFIGVPKKVVNRHVKGGCYSIVQCPACALKTYMADYWAMRRSDRARLLLSESPLPDMRPTFGGITDPAVLSVYLSEVMRGGGPFTRGYRHTRPKLIEDSVE